MKGRALAVASVLLTVGGLVVCMYALFGQGPSANVSSQPVAIPTSSSVPTPSAVPVQPAKVAQSPRLTKRAANAKPKWLSIPSVGISESIMPMGVNSAGELEPPAKQTIWYTGSPKPGAPGISMIAGHVESNGPANFWKLNEVPDKALITIEYTDGTEKRFEVTRKRSELKTAVQADASVWGTSKTPVLVLVTCDKYSQVVDGHHLNNFVVWARPVGG